MAYCILANSNKRAILADPMVVSPFLAGMQYMMRAVILVEAATDTQALDDDDEPPLPFYAAVEKQRPWITEQGSTSFSWLRRMIHLSATFALSSNQMPSFIWSRDGGRSFTYAGQLITLDELKAMMQASVKDAQLAMEEVFDTLQIPTKYQIRRTDLGDNPSERSTNFGFMNHGTNASEEIMARQALKDALDSAKFGRAYDGGLFWYRKPIEHALWVIRKFLVALGCAMYFSGGQPPRGTELLSTQLRNTSTRVRNMYIINRHAVNVSFVNKSSYRGQGDKAVARAFPLDVTELIINYTAVICPIEIALADAIGISQKALISSSIYLFHTPQHNLTTDDLNIKFRALAVNHLSKCSNGLTIRDLRQIMVYIGQKFVAARCTDDRLGILDIQAGHSTDAAKRYYGVEESTLSGNMTNTQLEAFTEMSFLHHFVCELLRPDEHPEQVSISQLYDHKVHGLTVHGPGLRGRQLYDLKVAHDGTDVQCSCPASPRLGTQPQRERRSCHLSAHCLASLADRGCGFTSIRQADGPSSNARPGPARCLPGSPRHPPHSA